MYPLPHFDLSDVFKEKLSIDSSDSAPFHLFGFLTIFRTNSFLKVWILIQFTDTVRGRNSYIRLCNATKTFTYSMSLNSNFLFFFQKCFSGAYQWNEKNVRILYLLRILLWWIRFLIFTVQSWFHWLTVDWPYLFLHLFYSLLKTGKNDYLTYLGWAK